jgi:hypothetical protein
MKIGQQYLFPFLFLALFLGLFSYRQAIKSDFIYDDNIRIAERVVKDGVQSFEVLPEFHQGLGSVLTKILPDRPLLMVSIWLNYLVSGSDPAAYKLTNILLHILSATLLFLLLLRIGEEYSVNSPAFAALLALLFLVHPLNSQAVSVVIQRGVILSSCFAFLVLLSAFDYLKEKKRSAFFACFLFFLSGILCKPNIAMLPLLILLLAWPLGKIKAALTLSLSLFATLLIPAIFYFIFRYNFHTQSENAGEWLNYALVQSKVIFHYLRQLVWPLGLNNTYPFPLKISLAEVWPYCLAHLLILGFAWQLARKSSLVGLGILGFYLAMAPESSFFPIPHMAFDHRMYFPMAFLALALFAVLQKLPKFAKFSQGLLAAAIVGGIFFTHVRLKETQDYLSWLRSSALRYKHDHIQNIHLLHTLWDQQKIELGKKDSAAFQEKYPDAVEYKFFSRLFEEGAPFLLAKITNQKEAEKLSYRTRSAMTHYLLDAYNNSSDPLLKKEHVHVILDTQQYSFRDASFARYRDLYLDNSRELHMKYLQMARNGMLSGYQREIWLSILLTWKKLSPAGVSEPWLEEVPPLQRYFLWRSS